MGITIIRKSNPKTRKLNPKVALVLAGGAVTGGAFKLGGLNALDDLLVNRKVVDFDIHIGLSAGAFLAAPIASGITPAEMLDSLDGEGELGHFRVSDVYAPNLEEMVSRPLEFVADLVSFFPLAVGDFLAKSPETVANLREPALACLKEPSLANLGTVASTLVAALQTRRSFPILLDYLPSGLFDNSRLERFIRSGFKARGLTNNFRTLYQRRGKELYIVAMNLDTAERVVFGHDEDSALTISEAVQASTALPGFYKPARIKGVDYIDGGVRRTANIDVALEHGADLVVCYNPFRPFNNQVVPGRRRRGEEGTPLAEHGMLVVLNQVFRSMLHSRLHLALNQYRDNPDFTGDIILIEPGDTDDTFFQMFPMNFWARRRAAAHGYLSVTASIDAHYETIRSILEHHGIAIQRQKVRESAERIQDERRDDEPLVGAGGL
ncbi:MAG TPA: patatin-like phospholipase family protein [Candidatus Binatia bacterium]|nr:patatin-like phospholipase family protein [Candidatus Binatia bacterium]